jgi:PAS domain S-box-containing protein
MLNLQDFTIVEQVDTGPRPPVYKARKANDPATYLIAIEKIEPLSAQTEKKIVLQESLFLRMLQEREDAQEETRRKEQFYKSLLENTFDNVIVRDLNGIITYVTPSVRQFGFEPEELIGQTGFEFMHPEDQASLKEHIEKTLCSPGTIHTGIQRVKQKNGNFRTLEVVARNLLEDEAVRGIVINFRDITEKQQSEQELARKEKYFRTLIENSFDINLTRDEAGIITYISPSIEQVLGYSPQELTGTLGIQMFHPDSLPLIIEESVALSMNPSQVLQSQMKLLHKNGRIVYVEAIAKNLLHDEAVRGILVTLLDITGRLEAENKLIGKEKYFRSLIENSTDVICIADKDVNFFYASPTVERILGYTPEEYLTLNGQELVHPDYLEVASGAYMQILQKPDSLVAVEFLYRHKKGHYVFLEVIFKNMLMDEHVKGVVMNSRDVTERKKAEEVLKNYNDVLKSEVIKQTDSLVKKNLELETILNDLKNAQMQLIQSEKLASLGQLTAGIAHEINNPINFVSANIEPLKQDFEELQMLIEQYTALQHSTNVSHDLLKIQQMSHQIDVSYLIEEIKALLTGIDEGAKRTKEIVMGLRNFSRLDESETKLANIHDGLDSTLMLLRHRIKNRITVERSYGTLPLIECYPGKLNQVFMNILTNAIQAIPGKGFIWINTWQQSNEIHISIKDSGKGMTAKVKDRIFEPFFTTKGVGAGTGLGLSISYGIIQKHNGKIDVHSQPGKGAEFIITLPVSV